MRDTVRPESPAIPSKEHRRMFLSRASSGYRYIIIASRAALTSVFPSSLISYAVDKTTTFAALKMPCLGNDRGLSAYQLR